jgi:CRP-like cAMP-binding protein
LSVERLPLLAGISPTDFGTVIASAREKCFRRRQVIFWEGDPVEQAVMLLSGSVKIAAALVWQVATFWTLLEHFPVFRRNAVHALEQSLQELEQRFREVSTERVCSRLSSELIRLSNRLGRTSNGTSKISLSRVELAQLTGTTLFTISRLLCQWQTLGIVRVGREEVHVRDFDALMQLSRNGLESQSRTG